LLCPKAWRLKSFRGPKPFGEPLGFDPITSTSIFGEYDAVLVDAMGTVAEAEALADWIALHNRNLETIYITHAHFDHFYGLSILLDRFPGALAIATAKTVSAMQTFLSPSGAVGPPALSWASGHQVGSGLAPLSAPAVANKMDEVIGVWRIEYGRARRYWGFQPVSTIFPQLEQPLCRFCSSAFASASVGLTAQP
jgi:hypothetical protein